MNGFANETSVAPEKTKAEIESTLRKYGAEPFVSGRDADRAFVMFRAKDRVIRFALAMPKKGARAVTHTETGKPRPAQQREAAFDQLCRTYWRLLLCIKAKLESVQTGIETFEEAFLAQIVLPDQTTVGDWAKRELPAVDALTLNLSPHSGETDTRSSSAGRPSAASTPGSRLPDGLATAPPQSRSRPTL